MNTPARQEQLRQAFKEANAIVNLEGLPFDEEMRTLQERVIQGEITIAEAIEITANFAKAKTM